MESFYSALRLFWKKACRNGSRSRCSLPYGNIVATAAVGMLTGIAGRMPWFGKFHTTTWWKN
jgi:hypothetical protein